MRGGGQRSLKLSQIIRGVAKAWFPDTLHFADTQSAQRNPWAEFASAHTAPYRKFGFTLAEVLITLGIIGIVASMTLPVLIQKNQEKVTISKLKKAYSALSQAYLFAVQEQGTPDLWNIKGKESIYDEEGNISGYDTSGIEVQRKNLTKFMKGRNCENNSKCIASDGLKYANLSRTAFDTETSRINFPRFMLTDGTIINFTNVISETCTAIDMGKANVCSHIEVFLPTDKREQRRGVNNFMFYLTKDGIVPAGRGERAGYGTYNFEQFCKNSPEFTSRENGHGCTAWVLVNENMDYLRCNDLSFNGKTKCR